jgi:AraC family transcriptional regulator
MGVGSFPMMVRPQLRIAATLDARWKTQIVSGSTYEFGRGEICVLPPEQMRRSSVYEAGELLLISIDRHFVERLASEANIRLPWAHFELRTVREPLMLELVRLVGNELQIGVDRGKIYAESAVLTMLGYLLRSEGRQLSESITRGGLGVRQLQQCNDHIESNIDAEITIESLARAANVSAFHFIRAFKISTGVTPHQYVLKSKVSYAKRLLAETDKPVSEIAKAVGFSSPGYFSTVFQRIATIPPSIYRSRLS